MLLSNGNIKHHFIGRIVARSFAVAIQKPPLDWKLPIVRPSHTWLRAIEADLKPQDIGLSSEWKKATIRENWRSVWWTRQCSRRVCHEKKNWRIASAEMAESIELVLVPSSRVTVHLLKVRIPKKIRFGYFSLNFRLCHFWLYCYAPTLLCDRQSCWCSGTLHSFTLRDHRLRGGCFYWMLCLTVVVGSWCKLFRCVLFGAYISSRLMAVLYAVDAWMLSCGLCTEPLEFREYCKRLFEFKTITVRRFQ